MLSHAHTRGPFLATGQVLTHARSQSSQPCVESDECAHRGTSAHPRGRRESNPRPSGFGNVYTPMLVSPHRQYLGAPREECRTGENTRTTRWSPIFQKSVSAAIAQLGEHQTEDLKVPGSIPGLGIPCQGWGLSAAVCSERQTSAPCGKSGARLGRHVSASDEEMVHGSGHLASEDKASCNG